MESAEKTCCICSQPYTPRPCHAKKARYCSKKCYTISLRGRGSVKLKCDICDKEYNRSPSEANYSINACSYKCRGVANRTARPVSKDYPSVRRWMKRRNMIKKCEDCGYDSISEILVVHHIDRDRQNNELENLKVLCPNCHAIEHLSENQKGWRHASTKRK